MIFLDTSICVDILRQNAFLDELLAKFSADHFGITSLSIFELQMGLYKTKFLKTNVAQGIYDKMAATLTDLLSELVQFSLDAKGAEISAQTYMALKGAGKEIQVFDCLIAGTIVASGYKDLITHNPRHFSNIPEIVVHAI